MTVYLQDPDVTILQGDALELLKGMPSGSVHMACTSPPFYGLRDYGTGRWEGGNPDCDHLAPPRGGAQGGSLLSGLNAKRNPDGSLAADNHSHPEMGRTQYGQTCGKCGATRVDQQIGLEATPDEWVARLVDVFRELRRVLRDDGSLWVEIGDSYGGAGNNKPHTGILKLQEHHQDDLRRFTRTPVGKPKDLIGAPWLLAFALRNDGWYLRSEIIWAKPNPMPESVSDRPTQSHSRVFLLTKQARYFYDAEAIREPSTGDQNPRNTNGKRERTDLIRGFDNRVTSPERNRRSVWTIATQPYPDAHFATWPEKLVEPMILAGTSERGVCPVCGAPWERTTESELVKSPVHGAGSTVRGRGEGTDVNGWAGETYPRLNKQVTTTGWQPTCTHTDDPVPATVLDVFGGSGTTALVARKHGRRAILLELNEDYCALAARRLSQQSLFAGEGETIAPPAAEPAPLEGTKNEQSIDHRKHGFNERWKAQQLG